MPADLDGADPVLTGFGDLPKGVKWGELDGEERQFGDRRRGEAPILRGDARGGAFEKLSERRGLLGMEVPDTTAELVNALEADKQAMARDLGKSLGQRLGGNHAADGAFHQVPRMGDQALAN